MSERASRKDAKPAVLRADLRTPLYRSCARPFTRYHFTAYITDTIQLDVILQSSLDNAILALALKASTVQAVYDIKLLPLVRKSIWRCNIFTSFTKAFYYVCISVKNMYKYSIFICYVGRVSNVGLLFKPVSYH